MVYLVHGCLCSRSRVTSRLSGPKRLLRQCAETNTALEESIDFLLGMGMARGLVGLAGPDVHDAVIDTIRGELVERYEPGIGLRLGAAA